jgi:hypothetical protein
MRVWPILSPLAATFGVAIVEEVFKKSSLNPGCRFNIEEIFRPLGFSGCLDIF